MSFARIEGEKAGGAGVPGALPRALAEVRRRLGVAGLDRLWIFPPLVRGRRERGLVVASLHLDRGERRRLVTVAYVAERTGGEPRIETAFTEEGEAPPEMLPRVMEGVARRAGETTADAREVEIGGAADRFDAVLDDYREGPFLEAETT